METDSSSERASVAVARLVRSKSLFARFTTKRYVCFFGHKAIGTPRARGVHFLGINNPLG
nr:MAG TPA: hypothetical protein [Caudoviricetes sp.]